MTMVVDPNTIIHPRTVTDGQLDRRGRQNLLVMSTNTLVALFAVFTSQWPSNHAGDAKVLFIKHPLFNELINRRLLLTAATSFGDKAWVLHHGLKVKVCREPKEASKQDVVHERGAQGCCNG
jgi:hypothetical protein